MLSRQTDRQFFVPLAQIMLPLALVLMVYAPNAWAKSKASKSFCKPHHINALMKKGRKNPRAMNVSPRLFYKEVKRKGVLSRFRSMKDGGFVGIDQILSFWNANTHFTDIRWLAYMLATTYHETAGTMKPIREYGKGRSRRYGRPDKTTGKTYYGRGYVQLTWAYNYKNADKQLGRLKLPKRQQLYWNPGIAMEFEIAKQVLFSGMNEGWFVKPHCLPRHFRAGRRGDWKSARRIINGLDKWPLIKREALAFVDVIKKSQIPINADKQVEIILNPPTKPTKSVNSEPPKSKVTDKTKETIKAKGPNPDLQKAKKVAAIYRKQLSMQTKHMEKLTSKINRLRDENLALKIKIEQQNAIKIPVKAPETDKTPEPDTNADNGTDGVLQQAMVSLLKSNRSLVRNIEKNQSKQSQERESLVNLNNQVLQQSTKSNKTLETIVSLLPPPNKPRDTKPKLDKPKDQISSASWWKYLWIK